MTATIIKPMRGGWSYGLRSDKTGYFVIVPRCRFREGVSRAVGANVTLETINGELWAVENV